MQHETSDIYERITNEIVAAIEAGAGTYRMPWHVTAADRFRPANVTSERFVALSISSTPMNTMIALRRSSTVAVPIENSTIDR